MSNNEIYEQMFDLDINNYTINDLKSFFKLPNGYDLLELNK